MTNVPVKENRVIFLSNYIRLVSQKFILKKIHWRFLSECFYSDGKRLHKIFIGVLKFFRKTTRATCSLFLFLIIINFKADFLLIQNILVFLRRSY